MGLVVDALCWPGGGCLVRAWWWMPCVGLVVDALCGSGGGCLVCVGYTYV